MGKRIIFMWLCLTFGVGMACGQHTIVKGIVTDSVTNEPLPYVSVFLKGPQVGVTTDDEGRPISTGTFLFPPVRREKCWKSFIWDTTPNT